MTSDPNALERLNRIEAYLASGLDGQRSLYTKWAPPAPPAPTPTPPPATVLWSANHETGDLAQWQVAQGGLSEYNSGKADSFVTSERPHSGTCSVKQAIDTTSGEAGTRLFRWRTLAGAPLPADAYYSAWLYYPLAMRVGGWLMVMGFKTKLDSNNVENAWFLYLRNREDGQLVLLLEDKINGLARQASPIVFPTGRWVHVEMFYKARPTSTGRITAWQDGVQIIDADGYQTQRVSSNEIARQFEVANYGANVSPTPTVRYVDDAYITTSRRGPT